MKTRITETQLKALVKRLNEITNSPLESYKQDESGKCVAQIGNYHISYAYGGVELNRMVNQGGGVTCPLGYGHGTKRELWEKLRAYISGIEAGKAIN